MSLVGVRLSQRLWVDAPSGEFSEPTQGGVMRNIRWLALAWLVLGGLSLPGAARAAAYDMHYSFYVTNTLPGGGPTGCTGQCLIDFAESIGVAPPEDLFGEFYVEANGVSRFYERDGWVDPIGFESYYPSRSGSTQVGNVDWGRIDIYTYATAGNYVACGYLRMELGWFANSCSRADGVPTLRALAAAGTYAPLELPVELGDGMFGTDGWATFTKVPEPGTFALVGLGLMGLAATRRRAAYRPLAGGGTARQPITLSDA
jgi:hypothetical protein